MTELEFYQSTAIELYGRLITSSATYNLDDEPIVSVDKRGRNIDARRLARFASALARVLTDVVFSPANQS